MITNETQSEIIIEYEVITPLNGFIIFDIQPTNYELTSKEHIDWTKEHEVKDLVTSSGLVKLKLPPNKGLIIGRLSNDSYKSYDQDFINGRHFNLKTLKIRTLKEVTEIKPETFDDYFVKQKGVVVYIIK